MMEQLNLQHQKKVNCWDTFTFNNLLVLGIMMEPHNLQHQKKCWDTFTFNNSTCTWDNDGTANLQQEKVNCWDTFTFNNSTCTWDNDGTAQPAAPEK
jgi:hypothetical protein